MEPSTKRQKTAHEVGLMRDSGFIGSASGVHFIQTVYGTADGAAHHLVPGEDDALLPTRSIWLPDEVSDAPFSFVDLARWTAPYFEHWHPCFPHLHAPSILAAMESYPQIDTYDAIILRSIMSISLADLRPGARQPAPRQLLFDTFDEALESIQPAISRPPTLKSIQALLTVQTFLISMLRLNAASRVGGLVIRMAYQMGIHRCPARYSSFTAEEASMRRRIFHSMYCLDRIISHSLGLPLTIRDDDVDVCDFEHEEHGTSPAMDHRLKMLMLLSRQARIRGKIMELRNKNVPHRDRSADAPTLIKIELTRWWNEVDDCLDQDNFSALQRTILGVLRNECIITLNRPLLALSKSSASYMAGLQSCIAASKAIISALHSFGGPLVWPSFTWAVWMSCFIIIFAASEGQIATEVAVRLTERAGKVLGTLGLRGTVWPDACATAVEKLRQSLINQSTPSRAFATTLGFAIPQSPPGQEEAAQPANGSQALDTGRLADINANPGQEQIPADAQPDLTGGQTQPVIMDMPRDQMSFNTNEYDPFQGFDIPFWVGQDHYAAWSSTM
ncbi:Transcriptional activator protein acu-15 [Cyphellophora attinorum]|uniref:Transcriptional activator protein acu-15 n=1 Tax=Cyphellophora attinorum TaxID=1664694 RepID=A0A0N1HB71_9EURO|nr:Transcriptional activator protein acu-15 [Phialophora attinorum]KPI41492.1 Transcriptional activator protein acu-15 [Phialophora attinorum]